MRSLRVALKAAPTAPISGGMGARVRENVLVLMLASLAVATVGWLTLYGFAWNDYDNEVAPAFAALTAGHVVRFLQAAPAYGGSVVLRAPFAALTGLLGGGPLAVYRAVSLPCLAAAAGYGIWLVGQMRAGGRDRVARAAVLIAVLANPIYVPTLEVGHPEEILGAVLCAAAVVLALRDRWLWAAIVLGLAVANKQWALLAVGPVLVALPRHRWRALFVAGGVTAAVLAPIVLVQAGNFVVAARADAVQTGGIFQPWQVWWFFGSHGHLVHGLFGNAKPGYRTPPGWLGGSAHLLIVAIGVPLSLLWARRRPAARTDALLLLALLMLLRCALDPWDAVYYALPFVFALLTWEALAGSGTPTLALGASVVVWMLFQWLPDRVGPDAQSLAFLACVLPAIAVLALRVYVPGALRRRRGSTSVRPLPSAV